MHLRYSWGETGLRSRAASPKRDRKPPVEAYAIISPFDVRLQAGDAAQLLSLIHIFYDPDGVRVELMNFHATEKPCCSAFTAEDPAE